MSDIRVDTYTVAVVSGVLDDKGGLTAKLRKERKVKKQK